MADNLGRDLLRKSRIRLNVACMLAFRSYFASLLMRDASINIWIDASSQWRSRELLASSFDLVIAQGDGAPKVERRLFPMLRIGIHLLQSAHAQQCFGKSSCLRSLIWRTRVLSRGMSSQSRRIKVRSVCWQTCLTCSLPSTSTSVLLCHKRLSLESGFFSHCFGSPGWNHIFDGPIETVFTLVSSVVARPQRTENGGSGTQWTGRCCDSCR